MTSSIFPLSISSFAKPFDGRERNERLPDLEPRATAERPLEITIDWRDMRQTFTVEPLQLAKADREAIVSEVARRLDAMLRLATCGGE